MIITAIRSAFLGSLLIAFCSISCTRTQAIDVIIKRSPQEVNLKNGIRRLVSFVEQSVMAVALYGATSAVSEYCVSERIIKGNLLINILGLLVAYTITDDVNAIIAQYNSTPE